MEEAKEQNFSSKKIMLILMRLHTLWRGLLIHYKLSMVNELRAKGKLEKVMKTTE